MIRIAVCDDEQAVCAEVAELIRQYTPSSYQVEVSLFNDGASLLAAHRREQFAMIYLDLRLEKEFGLDIAREIRREDQTVLILLLTYYIDYVQLGYEVAAFRYRLKPIEREVFQRDLLAMLETVANRRDERQIAVRTLEGVRYFGSNEILCVEIEDKRVKMTTDQGVLWPLDSMTYWLDMLGGLDFGEPYGKILVNLNRIVHFDHKAVRLNNGESVPVSRDKYKAFRQAVMALEGEHG